MTMTLCPAQQRALDRQRQLLEGVLRSRTFRAVEHMWRLRGRDPGFSREEIRRVLDGRD